MNDVFIGGIAVQGEIEMGNTQGNDTQITFKDAGSTRVFSLGYDDSANRFVIRGSETLGTNNFVFDYDTGDFGIGGDKVAGARLAITSTSSGVLLPRLTSAQVTTLSGATVSAGTLVYDTNLNKLRIYTGTNFETVTSTVA